MREMEKRGRKMTQLSVEIIDQTLLNEARNDSVFLHASSKLSVGGFDQLFVQGIPHFFVIVRLLISLP